MRNNTGKKKRIKRNYSTRMQKQYRGEASQSLQRKKELFRNKMNIME